MDKVHKTELISVESHSGEVLVVSFSECRNYLVSGGEDGIVYRTAITQGKDAAAPLVGHQGPVHSIRCVAGLVLTGSQDHTARVWDAASGRCLAVCAGHTAAVWSAVLMNGIAVTGSLDGSLRLYDLAGACLKVIKLERSDGIMSLDVSPSGNHLAVGCFNGSVRVVMGVETESASQLWSGRPHQGPVSSVAFSPNGLFIATGSWDMSVKIIHSDSGAVLRCLYGHTDRVNSSLFNEDGAKVISGSTDGTVRIWPIFVEGSTRLLSLCSGLDMEGEHLYDPEDLLRKMVPRIKRLLLSKLITQTQLNE